MLSLEYQNQFKKDIKNLIKRKWNMSLLHEVVEMLQIGEPLPEQYMDHALSGNWKDYRDCHVRGDWVLIYRIFYDKKILRLVRTGSHSDLGL